MDIAIPSLTIDRVREGLFSRRFTAAELAAEALEFAQPRTQDQCVSALFARTRAGRGETRG